MAILYIVSDRSGAGKTALSASLASIFSEDALTVGEIGAHLNAAPSTLAHHLGALVDAGLIIQRRDGRNIVNRVDFDVMRATLSFLTSECCTGVSLKKESAA